MRGSSLLALVRAPGTETYALVESGDDPSAASDGGPSSRVPADGAAAGDPPGAGRLRFTGDAGALLPVLEELARSAPATRLVWWDRADLAPLAARGARLRRGWDLQEVHRLLVGGWSARLDQVWASAVGLPHDGLPPVPTGDLFDLAPTADEGLVRADGYLEPQLLTGELPRPDQLSAWGALALHVCRHQAALLGERGPQAVATAYSESGAAVLVTELEQLGLGVDRPTLEGLITRFAGERPRSEAEAVRLRRQRDAEVLRHVPGREGTDLRNPAQVLELLRGVGVLVDDTRSGRLEAHRHTHPVVGPLLEWRKAERIATTYGWGWLDRHVGADDRLRGSWTVCDGGAGRMTAGAGLHSLPAALRPGIAAPEGRVLLRADLGQVEPRVLAVVSRDPAFAEASRADDLYADVAGQLGVDRPTAKIAVLAAMYGQTSGPAGAALARMERTYPTAMRFLQTAARRGEQGQPVQTYGGRVVRVARPTNGEQARATGRFTRNAVVQGAAAELFKAWALTVRAALADHGSGAGRIVLMLHDELLIELPERDAEGALDLVEQTLAAAGRRWSGGAPVRFVVDARLVHRWSEAKD